MESEGQLRVVEVDNESVEQRQGPPRDTHIKRALLRWAGTRARSLGLASPLKSSEL